MNLEIIKDKVFYFKDAIKETDSLIDFFSKTDNELIGKWVEWNEYAYGPGDVLLPGHTREYGFSKQINGHLMNDKISVDQDSVDNINKILNAINLACDIYKEKMNVESERKWVNQFSIMRYHEAEFNPMAAALNPHLDSRDTSFFEEHTILVYYNDDYIGGEIVFHNLDVIIKPEAGSIIMFQAVDPDLLHSTNPVTSGVKYLTLQMWIDGPIKGYDREGR